MLALRYHWHSALVKEQEEMTKKALRLSKRSKAPEQPIDSLESFFFQKRPPVIIPTMILQGSHEDQACCKALTELFQRYQRCCEDGEEDTSGLAAVSCGGGQPSFC